MGSERELDGTGREDPCDDQGSVARVAAISRVGASEALCARVRDGEASAIGELATRMRWRLKRFIGRFIPGWMSSKVDQSDVVQGVLASAWNHPSQITVPWLFGIAKKKALKELRHFRCQRRDVGRERPWENSDTVQTPAVQASPEESLIEQERQNKLRERLNALGDDGVLLRRIYLEDETYEQVGRDWGISAATLRKRADRAREKFKLVYQDDGVTPDE